MATGAIRAGAAYVELSLRDNRLMKGLAGAEKRLRNFGATVRGLGIGVAGVGASILAAMIRPLSAASDLEETMNKFNVVFGENAAEVQKWGDAFASEIGRSRKEVADFMAGTADLLIPLGFEAGAATDMSKEIVGLAYDLASFNNSTDADALNDLQAALTGSGEVMKKYGVVLSEAAVKQELLNQKLDPKTATEQQKAAARWAIILRGTTAAQGDALRSAGGFANQLKAVRGQVMDTAAAIGGALLPVVTPLLGKIREVVRIVGAWIGENKGVVKMIAALAGGAVVAGGLLLTFSGVCSLAAFAMSGLVTVGGIVASVFGAVGAVLATLLTPIGAASAAALALGGYLLKTTGLAGQAMEGLSGIFATLKADVVETFDAMKDALAAGDFQLAAQILWATLKLEFAKGVGALKSAWIDFKEFFGRVWTEAVYGTASTMTTAWSGLQTAWVETTGFLADAWDVFTGFLMKSWHSAVGFIKKAWVHLKSLFDEDINVEAEVARINNETAGNNAAVDAETIRQVGESDQDRRKRLAKIKSDEQGAKDALEAARQAEQNDLTNSAATEHANLEGELKTLAERRRKLLQDAAKQGAEAAAKDAGKAKKKEDASSGAASATVEAGNVQGSFSAFAASRFGGSIGAAARTAKASEETAANTRRLVRAARHKEKPPKMGA